MDKSNDCKGDEHMDACYLEIDGMKVRLDKVVATYEMWTMGRLPIPIVTIKVVARAVGDFHAVPNVVVKSPKSGQCEYTSGIGPSISEALQDAIRRFWQEVKEASESRDLEEGDLVWT
jgi:hypothetical protein